MVWMSKRMGNATYIYMPRAPHCLESILNRNTPLHLLKGTVWCLECWGEAFWGISMEYLCLGNKGDREVRDPCPASARRKFPPQKNKKKKAFSSIIKISIGNLTKSYHKHWKNIVFSMFLQSDVKKKLCFQCFFNVFDNILSNFLLKS